MPMPEEFSDLARRVNNWGRWGKRDEIGSLNLLTDDVVRRAAGLITTGARWTLGLPLSQDGPQIGAIPGRINPLHTMLSVNKAMLGDPTQFCSSDDVVTMGLQAGTHWDSLAHVSYDDRLYNGFSAGTIIAHGALRCDTDKIKTIAGRGVLLDVARSKGVASLDGAAIITGEDLDAAAELARTTMAAGDIVLLRTGQMLHFKAGDRLAYSVPSPGSSLDAVEWFHRHDLAAVATDNLTFEVAPPERDDMLLPVHLLDLVEMGMTQGQNWDLEDLAAGCADDGRYTFFIDATPQPFVGAVGTPVNPLVIK